MNRIVPLALLGLYLVVFVVCAINPYDRAVWWAENLPIVLIVAAIAITWRWHPFSPLACLLMSVLVYVDTFVTGRFKISYGRFGPTEVRALAVLFNVIFFAFGAPQIEMPYGTAPIYDLAVLALATILILIYIVSTIRRARELSGIDSRKGSE